MRAGVSGTQAQRARAVDQPARLPSHPAQRRHGVPTTGSLFLSPPFFEAGTVADDSPIASEWLGVRKMAASGLA